MAFPVHCSVPVRRTPWVTDLLITANVMIFLIIPVARMAGAETIGLDSRCEIEAFYDRYAAISEGDAGQPATSSRADWRGRRQRARAGCVVGPSTYVKIPISSVLSAMSLHGSWLYLLRNMLFLWVFGHNIEYRLGRLRYVLFYLLCGYVAAYGFALANPDSTEALVSASGAISGVLGAYLFASGSSDKPSCTGARSGVTAAAAESCAGGQQQ
jgi:membrane associated rhomboid family serine protease